MKKIDRIVQRIIDILANQKLYDKLSQELKKKKIKSKEKHLQDDSKKNTDLFF